jgi:hypothetical protein
MNKAVVVESTDPEVVHTEEGKSTIPEEIVGRSVAYEYCPEESMH